jgi:dTDP-4-dehydrorhamnose 3,5-epimerase
LQEDEPTLFLVPGGCGHGFFVLEEAIVVYAQGGTFSAKDDMNINYLSPEFNIQWPIPNPDDLIISDKDKNALMFTQAWEIFK